MDSKFIKELPELIQNGVISKEIASKIENYYNSRSASKSSSNNLFTIFGVLGSLLVGLGIILILAHNWDDFSKTVKSILAFLPLVVGQFIVGYSILKEKSKTWLESSGVFLFFAVGSSISLISQIYNIPGNLSSFLLSWILLCLPLIYLLKFKGVFLLTLIFATVYACSLGYSFSSETKVPWFYILLFALLLPQYFYHLKNNLTTNFTAILNWLFPLSLIIVFGAFLNTVYRLDVILYSFLLGFIYNVGQLKSFRSLRVSKNGFLVIGSLGLVITMLMVSFESFWNIDFEISFLGNKELLIGGFLMLSTLYMLIKNNSFSKFNFNNIFQFIPFLMILFYATQSLDTRITVALVNITVLVLGVSIVKKGVDKASFVILNYGLLIITALITCRFLDTEMTFIIRGLLFIIVGAGFFVTNYLMLKKQSKTLKK
ncbi:DUF2157 domain-containing protein [Polaribacter sp. Q13]|uniref:DUF2157 domain-containing protein n=1 Tax=Polaribacter sp. Q13 TaxID=2806551 RepID=UPI00193C1F12|nr:DUF2157 domain-containing protein [Polaribacter sp. Q13]QVY66535.1 DUF2157 domain-containing protein [Polaribacter sp. Q13]